MLSGLEHVDDGGNGRVDDTLSFAICVCICNGPLPMDTTNSLDLFQAGPLVTPTESVAPHVVVVSRTSNRGIDRLGSIFIAGGLISRVQV